LDGKHVVFGEVADEESKKIVKALEDCGTAKGTMVHGISEPQIIGAGQL